jgi:hypothetical protein
MRWIMKKTTRKLALKRQTLRVLSGSELGDVAGGTTIVWTAATTTTLYTVGITPFCAPTNRNTTDLAGR